MSPVTYIQAHQGEFWVFVGFAMMAVEAWALGFTSGVLLFGAVGALLTGILMLIGVLPETWVAGIAGFGILGALSAAVLWRPLMRLQHNHEPPARDRTSDLIGYEFVLREPIDATTAAVESYSGITWSVRPDPELAPPAIPAGTRVAVTGVDAGIFWVTPV